MSNPTNTYHLLPAKIRILVQDSWEDVDSQQTNFLTMGFILNESQDGYVKNSDGTWISGQRSHTWVANTIKKSVVRCQKRTLEIVAGVCREAIPQLKKADLRVEHLEDRFSVADFRSLIGRTGTYDVGEQYDEVAGWFLDHQPSPELLFQSKKEAITEFRKYRKYRIVQRFETEGEGSRTMHLELLGVARRKMSASNKEWGIVCKLHFSSFDGSRTHRYFGYVSSNQANVLLWQFFETASIAADAIIMMTTKGVPEAGDPITGTLLTVSEGPNYEVISESVTVSTGSQ